MDLLESMGLQQHVNVSTHKSGHTLDLIITRCAGSLLLTNPTADYLFSDHFTVISDLIIKKPLVTVKEISYRKIKNINIESFTNNLRESALCQQCPDSLHELVNLYNTTSSNTLDLHAPVITKTIKSRPLVPWFSVETKEARRERRKAERKWRHTRCYSDLLTFKLKKKYATDIMNKSRCEFYKSFISENSSDQKKLFSATKKLLNHSDETSYLPLMTS